MSRLQAFDYGDFASEERTAPISLPRGLVREAPSCSLCGETLERDDVCRYWCGNDLCQLHNFQQEVT